MEIHMHGAKQLTRSEIGIYASQSGGVVDEPEESKVDKDIPADDRSKEEE